MHRDKFLIIKPCRCTNFWNLFLEWNSTFELDVCLSVHCCICVEKENQLDATEWHSVASGWFSFCTKLYMFQTVPLSIIRSFSLYTQKWYMSYRFADSLRTVSGWNSLPSWFCSHAIRNPVWYIPLLCVQWKSPDDGQRNCLKHVEFHSKNKNLRN